MGKAIVYSIRNIETNKMFIGWSASEFFRVRKRAFKALGSGKYSNKEMCDVCAASSRFVHEIFEFDLMAHAESRAVAKARKKALIEQYRALEAGVYNVSQSALKVGRPGHRHTEEFKRKLSERLIGNTYTSGFRQSREQVKKRMLSTAMTKQARRSIE